MRSARAAAFLLFSAAFCLSDPPIDLKFEVASIKPSAPGSKLGTIYPAPGRQRYVGTNVSLKLLMTVAYRVNREQIFGPRWISDDLFDVNAQADKSSRIEELHLMLRNMLAERFKLRMHTETRTLPVYIMSVDRSGVKLKPSVGAGDPLVGESAAGNLTGHFTPMTYFAWLLGLFVDRPVLDQTGLKDVYDFTLVWSPDLTADVQPDSAPGLFAALRQQLGLRLDARRAPSQVIVVDHAEHPGPD